tara:strand:- start:138 stop:884 length:747 start_codon:yes stop_codon:yes gene_type:complete
MERPPKHLQNKFKQKALRYKSRNGNFAGLPRLQWGGDEWYWDNKGGGNLSLKSISSKIKEVSARRSKEGKITRQDYLDFASENGFSPEEANRLYEKNEAELKRINKRRNKTVHGDHGTSIKQGGPEHYRNYTLMYADDNEAKGSKKLPDAMHEELQIPRNKREAMAMDFAGVKPSTPRAKRSAMAKAGMGLNPNRPSNGGVKLPGVGRIGGSLSALANQGSGSEIVDRVNGKMHLLAPHLADIGFEFF